MARAVAAAMRDDAPLLFEAGTGVGKSLAYLVPGMIHAIDQSRQLIVSTHTISLQEQLETRDLPICRRLFKSAPELARYADFKSAVLVGKSNYLCTTRLGHALADRASLFADADYDELQRIATLGGNHGHGLAPRTAAAAARRSLGRGECRLLVLFAQTLRLREVFLSTRPRAHALRESSSSSITRCCSL